MTAHNSFKLYSLVFAMVLVFTGCRYKQLHSNKPQSAKTNNAIPQNTESAASSGSDGMRTADGFQHEFERAIKSMGITNQTALGIAQDLRRFYRDAVSQADKFVPDIVWSCIDQNGNKSSFGKPVPLYASFTMLLHDTPPKQIALLAPDSELVFLAHEKSPAIKTKQGVNEDLCEKKDGDSFKEFLDRKERCAGTVYSPAQYLHWYPVITTSGKGYIRSDDLVCSSEGQTLWFGQSDSQRRKQQSYIANLQKAKIQTIEKKNKISFKDAEYIFKNALKYKILSGTNPGKDERMHANQQARMAYAIAMDYAVVNGFANKIQGNQILITNSGETWCIDISDEQTLDSNITIFIRNGIFERGEFRGSGCISGTPDSVYNETGTDLFSP